MIKIYVSLDEEDFKCLIRGGILTINDEIQDYKIMISLKDIGFNLMDKALDDVQTGKEKYYEHRER